MQTPGLPVSRPQVAAMNAAPCSCRVSTSLIEDLRRLSTMSRFSSPGTPKMRSTPSFSSAATIRSEPLGIPSSHTGDRFKATDLLNAEGNHIHCLVARTERVAPQCRNSRAISGGSGSLRGIASKPRESPSHNQKYLLTITQIRTRLPPARAPKGTYRDRHDVSARVAMDAAGVSSAQAVQAKRWPRTAKSCGPGAATLASIRPAFAGTATVTKKAAHRGEHEGNRKDRKS